MKQYLKSFSKKKKKGFTFQLPSFSNKQKIGLSIFLIGSIYCAVQAQLYQMIKVAFKIKPLYELITMANKNPSIQSNAEIINEVTSSFTDAFMWFDTIKYALGYIVSAQESSISTVASVPISSASSFSHIFTGLTVFACVGCVYKIVTHFLKTERHDNLSAIFGYFSFLAPLVLFLFSGQIVNKLSGINRGINVQSVSSIGIKLNNELENIQLEDYSKFEKHVSSKLANILPETDFLEKTATYVDLGKDYASFLLGNTIKYIYFSFFVLIFTSVLAIPSFIMTFMVKILLSIMIAGAQIVFLLLEFNL